MLRISEPANNIIMNRGEQEFSLRWNNHENNICLVLESMLKRGALVDVTLSCEGKSFRVHRAILSACSPYFEDLFVEANHSHPIVILRDVKAEELQSLIDYMYTGQVTVSQSKLPSFLKVAQSLKIRGLVNAEQYQQEDFIINSDSHIPPRKRKRNFSAADLSQPSFSIDSAAAAANKEHHHQVRSEGPTDLSLPKLEESTEVGFQPVIQAVSYSAVDPTNANHSNKIYLKPKEALISPPTSDTSEGGSDKSLHGEQLMDNFLGMSSLANPDGFALNLRHDNRMFPEATNINNNGEAGTSYNSPSDDEDGDLLSIQDSESTAAMVRSGICNVCGCFRSDLRQHMESHSGQSFQCHLCGRAYPRRKTLNQHIKRSHQVYTRGSAQSSGGEAIDPHPAAAALVPVAQHGEHI